MAYNAFIIKSLSVLPSVGELASKSEKYTTETVDNQHQGYDSNDNSDYD